eukprot:GFUD01060480.1.p1 GENE.GFUD01060480.1~~GFUD01060480.1.p1  ORF type:complete len:232 (+),score=83.88 GFUD01060480.1:67-762(+)
MDGNLGNLPSPNFSNSEFLAFSSTPIAEKNFKPKWGKKNRNENWKRFGNSLNEGGGGSTVSTPSSYSSGNQYQQQGGNYQQSGGRWNRGGAVGHRGRGGYRGHDGRGYSRGGQNQSRGGQNQWSSGSGGYGNINKEEGYFHPSMLRDPWEELEREMGQTKQNLSEQSDWDVSLTVGGDRGKVLSDSLIPQVGDTLCERNGDMERSVDEAPDTDTVLKEDADNSDVEGSNVE